MAPTTRSGNGIAKKSNKVSKPDSSRENTAAKCTSLTMQERVQQARERYSSPAEEGPILVRARAPTAVANEGPDDKSEAHEFENTLSESNVKTRDDSESVQRSSQPFEEDPESKDTGITNKIDETTKIESTGNNNNNNETPIPDNSTTPDAVNDNNIDVSDTNEPPVIASRRPTVVAKRRHQRRRAGFALMSGAVASIWDFRRLPDDHPLKTTPVEGENDELLIVRSASLGQAELRIAESERAARDAEMTTFQVAASTDMPAPDQQTTLTTPKPLRVIKALRRSSRLHNEHYTDSATNTITTITTLIQPIAAVHQTTPEAAPSIKTSSRRSQRIKNKQYATSPKDATPSTSKSPTEAGGGEGNNEEAVNPAVTPPVINSTVMNSQHRMQRTNWNVLRGWRMEFLRQRGKLQWLRK